MICEEALCVCALSLCLRHEGGLARKIYDFYGSARAVFQQPFEHLVQHKGMRRSLVEKIADPNLFREAEDTMKWLQSKNVRPIFIYDHDYPYRLRECPDAPLLLYAYGQADWNAPHLLSIVGTRKATMYGKDVCKDIVAGLSRLGLHPVIVSGLAFGIDVTAHMAALEHGLPTIAVLPAGIDEIYPASHRSVAIAIAKKGLIVSEFPPKTQGNKNNFLQRNRIIAGLSDATLVIESAENGGALITAHLAQDYSRDVLAVPGRITDKNSKGCHNLIREHKAALVTGASDLAAVLQWDTPLEKDKKAVQQKIFDTLEPLEQQIVTHLHQTSGNMDALAEALPVPFPQLAAALTNLQIKGIVECGENKEFRLLLS